MTIDLSETELRAYYQEKLSGDGVCVITEDEFVAEVTFYKKDGCQVALQEFTGMPTTVDIDRSSMILDAQKLGQKTYQTILIVE